MRTRGNTASLVLKELETFLIGGVVLFSIVPHLFYRAKKASVA